MKGESQSASGMVSLPWDISYTRRVLTALGPVWPFQTTQVISGLSNFLNDYLKGAKSGVVSAADHTRLLKQYALLHYNPERGGILDLEEDYYPNTGYPIVGLKRSPHYFHSGYIDLVLNGLVGIRPTAGEVLEVNPLVDAKTITYFRAERVLYHGHEVAVQWDVNGSRYGSAGLQVEVDGKVVASSPTLTRLSIPVARAVPKPFFDTRIAKSVQLNSTIAYPRGKVSVPGVDAKSIYGSIDGRIWFFPETDVANGWSTPIGNGTELWFQVDLGTNTSTSSAQLAFFANNGQGFDVPEKYKVQVASGNTWVDAGKAQYGVLVANGITEVKWAEAVSGMVRLVFTPKSGKKVRLVEFKIF